MIEASRGSKRIRYKIIRDGELLKKEPHEFFESDILLCSYTGCESESTVDGMATVRFNGTLRVVKLILCQAHSDILERSTGVNRN